LLITTPTSPGELGLQSTRGLRRPEAAQLELPGDAFTGS
jgi:hypothetical protein